MKLAGTKLVLQSETGGTEGHTYLLFQESSSVVQRLRHISQDPFEVHWPAALMGRGNFLSRPPTHPARKCALVAPRFGTLRRYHAVVHAGCARSAGLGRFGDVIQDGTWWYKAWSQVLVGCWLVHAYRPALLCQSVTLASILLFLVILAVHGSMRRNTF